MDFPQAPASNSLAYLPVEPPLKRRAGRPKFYGEKVRLRDIAADQSLLRDSPSPIPGEAHVTIRFGCFDLLWRPVGHLVRFVIVDHPLRGRIVLMTTDTDMDPLDVIVLYSHRFKIETGFRQAIHVLGACAYHFWMQAMDPIRRRSGNQHLHMKSPEYRHLALNHGAAVWEQFRSWLRTMDPSRPPSELVVACSLRDTVLELLDDPCGDHQLGNFAAACRRSDNSRLLRKAG